MTTKDYNYYKQQLAIDQHNLDAEMIRQPVLFHDVCEEVVRLQDRVSRLKADLKSVDANLNLKIRESGAKVTQDAVQAQIETHPDHTALIQQLSDAVYEQDRWATLRETFRDRTFMLKELSNLYSSNYFTRSYSKSGNEDVVNDANRQALASARRERARLND